MGSQPFLGQRAGCRGRRPWILCPSASGSQATALPEPRAFRTGQGGGAELGRKVQPDPRPGSRSESAPPRGGNGGQTRRRARRRTPGRPRPSRERVSGSLGRFLRRPPPPSEGARRPQPASPESGLAGANGRGRAGTPVGAGAREKARGPEIPPAPRASRPSACPADACLRTPTCPVQLRLRGSRSAGQGGQLGSEGRPGSLTIPLQPHWEDGFPQPQLVSGGDLSPTCPRGSVPQLSWRGSHPGWTRRRPRGCCDGTDGHVGSSLGTPAAGNGAGASRGSLCWCVSLITAFKRLKSDCLC